MDILNKVDSISTGLYLHYKELPKETMFERSIAEKIKLRKERFDEIKRKEQNIDNELFKAYLTDYQSPSDFYKKWSKTENAKMTEIGVDLIEKVLTKFKIIIHNVPRNDVLKIEEIKRIIDIAGRIIGFNDKIKSGQRLKILTPN